MKWIKALVDKATTVRSANFSTTLTAGEYTYG